MSAFPMIVKLLPRQTISNLDSVINQIDTSTVGAKLAISVALSSYISMGTAGV